MKQLNLKEKIIIINLMALIFGNVIY